MTSDAIDRNGPNAEQIAYWNEQSGPKWVSFQEQIDARIASLGELAIERAAPRPGERVLDVGCGCGQTSLALAERVTADGSVLGADISGVMLARARERAQAAGLAQLRFEQADAQTHAFEPGTFDLVFSRFGVMFFADPTAAFANLRRALRPGGRCVFACWRPLAENAWAMLPVAALAKIVPLPEPPAPGTPGPFAFADPEHVRGILDGAGFDAIEIDAQDRDLDLAGGQGLDAAVHFAVVAGPTARLLQDVTDEQRPRVEPALREALEPHVRGQSVPLGAAIWIVRARRSESR